MTAGVELAVSGLRREDSQRAPGLLEPCALMRRHVDEPRRVTPDRSRAAGRRRRLRVGIDRWHADTCSGGTIRNVLLVALTVAEPDPLAARGAIRDLWHDYRAEFGRRPYFSWIELQRRGAVHYHVLLVNPPWALERDARRWLQQHWRLASIQPSVQARSPRWFRREAGAYARAYAKKIGHKAYQQAYDSLPRELRTFESNRLAHTAAELDKHIDKYEVVCTAPPGAPWWQQLESLWIVAHWTHVTERRWCTLRAAPGGACYIARDEALYKRR